MEQLLERLRRAFPSINYKRGQTFCWSPPGREVFYVLYATDPNASRSLLHETSHALLDHASYRSDVELLLLEVAAWEKTKMLAQQFDVNISEDHIQDCLDTYRDWLYARSICPQCANKSLEQPTLGRYRCFNCHITWKVTPSRFCRAYRATNLANSSTKSIIDL